MSDQYRRPIVRRAVLLVACSLLVVAMVSAQSRRVSSEEFSRATTAEKKLMLNELGSTAGRLAPAQLELVRGALSDESPEVQERALWMVAKRAAGPDSQPAGQDLENMRQEHAALLAYRPNVLSLLTNDDTQVRLAALAALTNLALGSSRIGGRFVLEPEIVTILAAQYQREGTDQGRAQIVSAFATFPVTQRSVAEASNIISGALADSAPAVVQAALRATMKHRLTMFLPQAVALLRHARFEVRITAAQAVSTFGPAANDYVGALRRALGEETHPIARKALEAAINNITR